MAFDKKPNSWIANWSEDATNITVPLASFPEMTAEEADATGGDIRKVLYAILECLAVKWYDTDAANRPTKMTINKSMFPYEIQNGTVTNTYTISFINDITAQEVDDEPT